MIKTRLIKDMEVLGKLGDFLSEQGFSHLYMCWNHCRNY